MQFTPWNSHFEGFMNSYFDLYYDKYLQHLVVIKNYLKYYQNKKGCDVVYSQIETNFVCVPCNEKLRNTYNKLLFVK